MQPVFHDVIFDLRVIHPTVYSHVRIGATIISGLFKIIISHQVTTEIVDRRLIAVGQTDTTQEVARVIPLRLESRVFII